MIDTLARKYKVHLITIPIALYFIPLIIHTFLSDKPLQYLGIGFLSLITFPIGLLMSFLIIGIHVKNPFVGKNKIGSIAKSFFYIFYFGPVLFLLVNAFYHAQDEFPLNFLPGALGIACGCFLIWGKYSLKENVIKAD